jgi:hypothetical protein
MNRFNARHGQAIQGSINKWSCEKERKKRNRDVDGPFFSWIVGDMPFYQQAKY